MSPGQIFAIIVGVAFLILLLALLKRTLAGPGALPYFSRGHLLSQGELAFYHALRRAVPEPVPETPVIDLMDALKRSVAETKGRKPSGRKTTKAASKDGSRSRRARLWRLGRGADLMP